MTFEFIRYVFVGGFCSVVDMAINYVMLYHILGATTQDKGAMALSVAAGFAVGLALNYILSNLFVFKTEEQRKKGKTFGAFMIYAIVGIIGFVLTELLTFAGSFLIGEEGIWYIILTCFVKGIVLIWNYAGRKIFVYKGK